MKFDVFDALETMHKELSPHACDIRVSKSEDYYTIKLFVHDGKELYQYGFMVTQTELMYERVDAVHKKFTHAIRALKNHLKG